jgi:transglutaminase-like putative cysteine protease
MKNLVLSTQDFNEYLKCSEIVNFENETVRKLADRLSEGFTCEQQLVKEIFEYVRDNISHSGDVEGEVVTCSASEVIKHGQGICYAKSHLLAALLRCLGIPTGFCYQRLVLDDDSKPWLIIHALNAVYLKSLKKWIRLDARGNKEGVNAQFSTNSEMLAFTVRKELGEENITIIFAEPNYKCVNALKQYSSVDELLDNLPTEL